MIPTRNIIDFKINDTGKNVQDQNNTIERDLELPILTTQKSFKGWVRLTPTYAKEERCFTYLVAELITFL